ncbi:MAG: MFS transporter, partial [Vicinamibacterales bacterium]|nr:MFS transporter [Vicinamibacterales bacterium]
MSTPVSWRRNQFAVTAASFMGFMGFTLVMPFLPSYIRQLGARDLGEIAMWAGLSLGATPAVTAVLSPLWGRVADRYGRKLLVQRSLLSIVVIMAAMAWVTRPWHIFALRAVQGVFAGYGGLTLAMAAESAPRERMGRAIGLVQTAQRMGPALGPVIGGVLAGFLGIRRTFFVTSAFYAVSLLLVSVLYREPGKRGPQAEAAPDRHTWRTWLSLPGFLRMLVTIFTITFVERSLGPVLPLWIGEHGVPAARVAVISGVLFSAGAAGAALGNYLCEAWLRRYGAVRVISLATLTGAGALAGFVWGASPGWLATTMLVFGGAMGAATTVAYTEGGRHVPQDAHGEGFAYLNAANLAGLALSPIVAGVLSRSALSWVFAIDMLLLATIAALLHFGGDWYPR